MPRVVAVGRFDGVHRGHQFLLGEARRLAGGLPVAAYTFPPRGPSLLTLAAKERLLREHADEVVVARWEDVRGLGAEEFVRTELVERLEARAVVVGPDHRFGRGRGGDVTTLRRLGGLLGLAVHAVDPLRLGGGVVSAARIRDLIAAGDVTEAALLLGRPVWLTGVPVPGARVGRTLGYPTVNLDLAPELVRPRAGVYAAWAQWRDGEGRALFYLGDRPTFPDLPPSAEIHLLSPPPGAVDGPVEVHLMRFVRPDARFPTVEALVERIARDREEAGVILRGTASPARLLPDPRLRGPGGRP
ncbi:MAG: bifunctional riboflavin kinase/FAD synthetase [Candidatus Bipolaricaulota bacterium]|nr:adenylyltransferase/cytidyltransferase family protein [Candidatus Bipolaricaulota bacterium]